MWPNARFVFVKHVPRRAGAISDKSLVCIVSDIGCRICFLGFCFVEFDNEDVVDMVMQKQYHDLAQGIKVSGNYYAQDGMYILVK